MLVRTLHTCSVKFPDVAVSIVPLVSEVIICTMHTTWVWERRIDRVMSVLTSPLGSIPNHILRGHIGVEFTVGSTSSLFYAEHNSGRFFGCFTGISQGCQAYLPL